MWTRSSGITVRALPDPESSSLGYFDAFEKVDIVCEIDGSSWVGVIYEGELAFVNSAYLDAEQPA